MIMQVESILDSEDGIIFMEKKLSKHIVFNLVNDLFYGRNSILFNEIEKYLDEDIIALHLNSVLEILQDETSLNDLIYILA